jgi:hypothetical protein
MVKAANLHRLESLERRIGERSLEHEAMAYQKLLERLESPREGPTGAFAFGRARGSSKESWPPRASHARF